jgi:hypothetical protein
MSDFDDFEDFDGEISENPDVKDFLAGMFQTDDDLAGYSDEDKALIREFLGKFEKDNGEISSSPEN